MKTKQAATPTEILLTLLTERAAQDGISMRAQLNEIGCSYAQWMALIRGEQRLSAPLMAQLVRRYPEYLANVIDVLRKDPSFDKQHVRQLRRVA
jgi:plasmid maintenance system antidote protein VapI